MEEIARARAALATAREKHAGKYAGDHLKEASAYYDKAMAEWKKQNESFFAFRNYSFTAELAKQSYISSVTAALEADKSSNRLKYNAGERLSKMNQKAKYFEIHFINIDLSNSVLTHFHNGKTRLLEAGIEYNNDEYVKAMALLLKADEELSKAEKLAYRRLAEFYSKYPKWQDNVRTAINLSKKGQTVLLVDKLSAELIILRSGKEYLTIPVELGQNWMDDKIIAGDKATPEGIYKVTAKKNRSKTKYYKALLLNYPNSEDKKEYDQLVRTRKIPKSKGIGGLIEIHGEGGKGIHWTDGCIAVENSAMDYVFRIAAVNTPVIIVGARQSMDEYLK